MPQRHKRFRFQIVALQAALYLFIDMNNLPEETLWDIRAFVYQHLAEMTRAPSVDKTAIAFALTHKEAASAFEALHNRHAFFLSPGTHNILIANPFSGIETPFRVREREDIFRHLRLGSLGIPAALHTDRAMEAFCSQSEGPINLRVRNVNVSESDSLDQEKICVKNIHSSVKGWM
jgi:hypothetical protein